MNKVYTLGYAGMSLNDFQELLKQYKITEVLDVRSIPRSSRFKEYNSIPLSNFLKSNNIKYNNYKEFGAIQTSSQYFSSEGYLDFEEYTKSSSFQNKIRNVFLNIEHNENYLLLCAEIDPAKCHRSIMISRYLFDLGIEVIHLYKDSSIITHKELEDELLNHYFPNFGQISIFDTENTKEKAVELAYRLRNKEIGCRLGRSFLEKEE